MLRNGYYESIDIKGGKNFIVSNEVNMSYIDKVHWHPFVEILISISDGNEVEINFTKYTLNLNDILIIYPGDLHAIIKCAGNSLWVAQFSSKMLSIINELNSQMALLTRFPYLKYDSSNADCDRIVLVLKEFFAAQNVEAHMKEVRMYALLLNFFEKVWQNCTDQRNKALPETGNPKQNMTMKMADVCLYISENFTTPLTLDDAAQFMGVSKSYFAHLFRQYTNSTFVDFLTDVRVKRAQSLFLNPGVQIIDIAFDSGFSSLSSFNRSFKKNTGLSPSKFREAMITHTE
ncbi:MAG TPA: AraC family transcriptional regulator [Negativicutes bacterium]|nr:AraC family transcriptional regulator [Negativicutes bacterium]